MELDIILCSVITESDEEVRVEYQIYLETY